MGIDRIFSILTEQANVRDVIMFPLMKPEGGTREQGLGTSETSRHPDTERNEVEGSRQTTSNTGDSSAIPQNDVAVVTPPLPTIEQAEALTETYLKDTLRHSQQVGQVMKYF